MERYPNTEYMISELLKDAHIFKDNNGNNLTREYLTSLSEQELYKIFSLKVHNDSLF